MVSERLQLVRARLPQDVNPVMAPISSIMGEVMIVGLRPAEAPKTAEEALKQGMDLRTFGEFTVRNRLLAIDGVSQVSVMGGYLKQYQVITSPERLAAQNVTLQQLTEAAEKSTARTPPHSTPCRGGSGRVCGSKPPPSRSPTGSGSLR